MQEQIPSDLWRAITDPLEYMAQGPTSEDAEGDPDPISVEEEDVRMLLATVQQRLAPFAATQAEDRAGAGAEWPDTPDGVRAMFVNIYRNGQRKVLEDAVTTLEGMLSG